jgi:preprotein translocase SecE subunit
VAEWSIAAVLKTASGLRPTGVRIPPSPPESTVVNVYIKLLIWAVLIGGLFFYLWKTGQLARFAAYVAETREELKKCTWPSLDELKGSTVVVTVSMALLGGFTVFADFVFNLVVRWLTPT